LTTSVAEEEPGVVCIGVVLVAKDGDEDGDENEVEIEIEAEDVEEDGDEVVEDGDREEEVEEVEEEKEALDCGPLPKSRPPTKMRSLLGFLPEMVPETSELKSGFTSS
jgi:hypothetical protein